MKYHIIRKKDNKVLAVMNSYKEAADAVKSMTRPDDYRVEEVG
jgi:hypothetical protein